jgi:hypothetical protein
MRRSLALAPILCALAFAVFGTQGPAHAQPGAEPKPEAPPAAPTPAPAAPAAAAASAITIAGPAGTTLRCKEQAAQAFLIRGNWFKGDPKAGQKMLADAIKYRTEKYGFFPGFGQAGWNAHPPRFYAETTSFMGLSIQLNKSVIPALKCVEAALNQNGEGAKYHPKSAGGIRFQNTYKGSEVSNHVYGIALDIEPHVNTCCGCVKPWNEHPMCKKKVASVYERMAMPKSWVETFEKYGFYWLGHDVLQDTMHYEFLGDPDQITEPAK